jgi:hypothetical protein
MGAGGALQQQAVLAGRALDIRRVFLRVDLTRILKVTQRNSSRIFGIEMRQLGGLRLPGRQ